MLLQKRVSCCFTQRLCVSYVFQPQRRSMTPIASPIKEWPQNDRIIAQQRSDTWIKSMDQIRGSDPWIWPMDLIDFVCLGMSRTWGIAPEDHQHWTRQNSIVQALLRELRWFSLKCCVVIIVSSLRARATLLFNYFHGVALRFMDFALYFFACHCFALFLHCLLLCFIAFHSFSLICNCFEFLLRCPS